MTTNTDQLKLAMRKGYEISVDNSIAQSHNINIDCPTFFCFALSENEAKEKMMKSDFQYKHKDILSISVY